MDWIETFFIANSIVEQPDVLNKDANRVIRQRKRGIFLIKIGPESYSTLSNLLVPMQRERDTPLADIV